MAIPENAESIYQFLIGHGYTQIASEGILGNIEQESGGNPSAGSNPPGSGLIQQLGYPTGTSLEAAEQDILTYNNEQGSQLINELNAQPDPASAALFYSNYFERPAPATANNSFREQSAQDVASAVQSGNWGTGSTSSATLTNFPGGNLDPLNWFGDVASGTFPGGALDPLNWGGILANKAASSIDNAIKSAAEKVGKDIWSYVRGWLIRLGLIVFGVIIIIVGINGLLKGNQNTNITIANPKEASETGEAEIGAARLPTRSR